MSDKVEQVLCVRNYGAPERSDSGIEVVDNDFVYVLIEQQPKTHPCPTSERFDIDLRVRCLCAQKGLVVMALPLLFAASLQLRPAPFSRRIDSPDMPAWDAETPPSAFSARIGMCFGPPTDAPLTAVRDVLICPVNQNVKVSPEEFRRHPPVSSPAELRLAGIADPVDLGRGLRVDRLENEEAELVFSACMPRGHFFVPVRQFGQRFAFVRDRDPADVEGTLSNWDPDGVIYDALAYSRLVRDHGFSREWAARIVDYADGEQMVVYTPGHELKLGYRLRSDRDWLDADEAADVRSLLASYWAEEHSLPSRLTRAMWRFEYAYSQKWVDVALPTLVSGLEALTRVGHRRLTSQFATRTTALAEELRVEGFETGLARRLYDGRSDWVHASAIRLLQRQPESDAVVTVTPVPGRAEEAIAEVALLQEVLRRAIRKAIEDPDFRATFEGDEAIQERWPVSG